MTILCTNDCNYVHVGAPDHMTVEFQNYSNSSAITVSLKVTDDSSVPATKVVYFLEVRTIIIINIKMLSSPQYSDELIRSKTFL